MKKTFFISFFFLISFMILSVVPYVFAATTGLPSTQEQMINPFKEDATMRSPIEDVKQSQRFVVQLLKWFYTAIFVVAVVVVLMAAMNFVRGGSDEKKLKLARAQLKWAVVGIAVGLIAVGVTPVINDLLSNTYV